MSNKDFRPLGKALNVAQSTSLEVTYTYDDLIFVQHNPFLLRFDEKDINTLHLHFNTDCEEDEAKKLSKVLIKAAKMEGLALVEDIEFSMEQKEGTEEIEIRFLN